jgi:hypothetical protein
VIHLEIRGNDTDEIDGPTIFAVGTDKGLYEIVERLQFDGYLVVVAENSAVVTRIVSTHLDPINLLLVYGSPIAADWTAIRKQLRLDEIPAVRVARMRDAAEAALVVAEVHMCSPRPKIAWRAET